MRRIWMDIGSLAVLCVLAGGCVYQGEPRPRPAINEPVDAFDSVADPVDDTGAPLSGNDRLSSDIQRLSNARALYDQAQDRRTARAKRRQAECRRRSDARTVPIQDGSGDPSAVYCQRSTAGPDTAGDEDNGNDSGAG